MYRYSTGVRVESEVGSVHFHGAASVVRRFAHLRPRRRPTGKVQNRFQVNREIGFVESYIIPGQIPDVPTQQALCGFFLNPFSLGIRLSGRGLFIHA